MSGCTSRLCLLIIIIIAIIIHHPTSFQRDLLRFRTPIIEQHQQIRRIQPIESRPTAYGLPHRDLIPPRRPSIRTRDELRRRISDIVPRWCIQLVIFICLEAHSQIASNGDNLRRAGARIGTAGRVDYFPISPGLAIICGCDRCDAEQASRLGFEYRHERIPGDSRHTSHSIPRGGASARYSLRCTPRRATVGGESL